MKVTILRVLPPHIIRHTVSHFRTLTKSGIQKNHLNNYLNYSIEEQKQLTKLTVKQLSDHNTAKMTKESLLSTFAKVQSCQEQHRAPQTLRVASPTPSERKHTLTKEQFDEYNLRPTFTFKARRTRPFGLEQAVSFHIVSIKLMAVSNS